MGTINMPSDSGSGGTESTAFIQCIDGREPQIHELWYLGLDRISHKINPAAHVDVTAGIVGEFVTYYLAENRCQIDIIGKISIKNSIQFLFLSHQSWGSGLLFIYNLLDHVESTGWGSVKYYNRKWGGRLNDATRITNAAWCASVNPRPAYLLRIPVNPHAN